MSDIPTIVDLAAGDVAVRTSPRGDLSLVTIERVTAAQIVADGQRYRRRDGRAIGSRDGFYERATIEVATPELLAHIEAERARRGVMRMLGKLTRPFTDFEVATLAPVLADLLRCRTSEGGS